MEPPDNRASSMSEGATQMRENGTMLDDSSTTLSPYTSYYLKTITPTLMQHMHSEPVIQQLLSQGLLTPLDIQCLEALFVSKQVEYLVDKVVLPGDMATLRQFIEALRHSAYHVNLNLAHLVEVGLKQEMDTGTISEEFLSAEEKDEIIETFYQPFLENGEFEDLTTYLESSQVIDHHHMTKVTELSESQEKASFLFDEVLLRGTYQTLEGFRQALKITGQEQLAKLLPHRNL